MTVAVSPRSHVNASIVSPTRSSVSDITIAPQPFEAPGSWEHWARALDDSTADKYGVIEVLSDGPTGWDLASSEDEAQRRSALCTIDSTPGSQFKLARLRSWPEALMTGFALFDLPAETANSPAAPISDALRAVDELREWLDLRYEDVAAMAGIAKNTIHNWRRVDAEPRPSTVRRLWRIHALIRALIAHMGREEAADWLRAGPRSRLDLLLEGELESVENEAHVLLFRHPPDNPADQSGYSPFRPEPEFDVQPQVVRTPLRRAQRRPARGRLSSS